MPIRRKGLKVYTKALTASANSNQTGTLRIPNAGVIEDIVATSHSGGDFTLRVSLEGGEDIIPATPNPVHGDMLSPANAGRIRIRHELPVNPVNVQLEVTDLSGSSNTVYVTIVHRPTEPVSKEQVDGWYRSGNPAAIDAAW